jgi:hypothetical protein
MDVSGQYRTPTALSQGRDLWLLLDMRMEGPEVGLYGGAENSLDVQESKLGSPSPYWAAPAEAYCCVVGNVIEA